MPLDRDRIAHYKLLRIVGAGAMGEVYEAEDEHLHRQVALKVIAAPGSDQSDMRRRFLREAHAAAAFTHPNVAHIYDVGTDDGVDYIAMEYIDGETLAQVLARGALAIDEIVGIALQLVDALAAAHDRGVVHRDIKPSNVMITTRGQVKMLDFGLAHIKQPPAAQTDETLEHGPSTAAGMIVGTTSYMSPEQALGESPASASDVFSVGVVLYEMITGRRPFAGKTAADTLHRITGIEPEPLARFNYELPIELERIVRKCLEKTASHRYRSAGELLVDLKALGRNRSSGARSAPRWAAGSPPQRRHIAAIVIVVAIGAAIVLWALLNRRAPVAVPPTRALRSVAVLPFSIAGVNDGEYMADGIAESLINALAEDSQIRVMAQSTVFRFKHASQTPQQIGRQLGVDAVVTANVLQRGNGLIVTAELVSTEDGAHLWGERYERKVSDVIGIEDDLASGISHALQLRRAPREQIATSERRGTAHALYLRGQYAMNERTPESIKSAVEDFRRAIVADPGYAPPYAALADTFILSARYAEVRTAEFSTRVHEAANKALQLDPSLPEAHVALASVYDTCDWNWPAAAQEYRKAIALRPSYLLAHQWYALLLTRLARFDEAQHEIQIALVLDPLSAVVNLAAAYIDYHGGRYAEAESFCRKAIALDPNVPLGQLQMALILMQQSQFSEAGSSLNASGSSDSAIVVRAVLQARQGRTASAEATMSQLAARDADYGLAVVAASLGSKDLALQSMERAFARRNPFASYAKVDPLLVTLHDDPRFLALLDHAGLR